MAVTRIKNNQVADGVLTGGKLVDLSITAGKLENDLSYGSNLTVSGNLTVNGATNTVSTTNTTVEDAVMVLNSEVTGTGSARDMGIYGEYGDDTSVFMGYDASESEFAFVETASAGTAMTITPSDYANLHAGGITADDTITGGTLTDGTATITSGAIASVTTIGASGTITGGTLTDGTATITSGAIASVTTIGASGAITGGSLTDGTATLTSGALTGATNITGSGTLTGGTLTDGTFSVTSGAITGATSVAMGGALSGATTIGASGLATVGSLTDGTATLSSGALSGVTTLGTTGEATLASATVSDLTATRVTFAGTSGALTDDADLTYTTASNTLAAGNISTGGTMTATGAVTGGSLTDGTATLDSGALSGVTTLGTSGEATLASAIVSDLTATRVTFAGTSGALVDDADLTYTTASNTLAAGNISTGGTMTATGAVTGGTITDGTATITSGAIASVTTIGASGAITGGSLTTAGTLNADGTTTLADLTIDASSTIDMGANKITNVATPVATGDATTKGYVDGLLSSGFTVSDSEDTPNTSTISSGDTLTFAGTANEIDVIVGSDSVTLSLPDDVTIGNDLTVDGDLTVNGTTTTVNSTVTTVADPIFQVGRGADNAALASDDAKDRGMSMYYYEGSEKIAFMGFDTTNNDFRYYSDASITGEVVSGTLGAAVFGKVTADNIDIDASTITSNNTNGNLNLAANGTGKVTVPTGNELVVSDLDDAAIIFSSSGELTTNSNLGWDGSTLAVTGAATISTTLGVTGESTLASATVSDLTSGRVVLAGTSGALEDNSNLTFNGSTLAVTGAATISTTLGVTGAVTGGSLTDGTATLDSGALSGVTTLGTSGEATLASAIVSDLTATRVTFAGTSGALVDDADLTYTTASNTLAAGNISTAGTATVGSLTDGTATLTSGALTGATNITGSGTITGGTVTDGTFSVTSGAVTGATTITASGLASLDGGIDVDGAFTVADSTGNIATSGKLDVTGAVTGGSLTDGTATLSSGALSGATTGSFSGTVTAGAFNDGAATYDAGTITNGVAATFSGTATVGTLTDGTATLSSGALSAVTTLGTSGEATLASAIVSDLTDNRITIAGTSGALEDDANLTWNGTTMLVGGATATTDVTFKVNTTDAAMLPVGTNAQRPTTGVVGMLRFNTTSDSLEQYAATGWEAVGALVFTVIASQTFDGDDSTVAFTLSETQTTASCIVSINGVVQLPTTAYAVSSTTLTFTEAPATGDKIEVRKITTTTTITNLESGGGETSVTTGSSAVDIKGDVLPTVDATYDLGSASKKWAEVHAGTITGGTLTDGTATITSGAIASVTTIGASGAITGGTITDGTFSVTSGAVTGATTLAMGGALSGVTTLAASGVVTLSDTTTSTSSTTGALKVAGGAGVAENLNVGGNVIVTGNLTVSGTQTTVNSATLDVTDKNITIADGAADSAAADGAGLTVDGASATFTYTHSGTKWNMNKNLDLGANNFITSGEFQGTATSAQYADLAEKYEADADYAPGTVVHFGGDKEVAECDVDHCTRVAGVVSTAPAYRMNDGLEAEHTAMVALQGRVPCKVTGPVAKGDMMVSAGNGMARAEANPTYGAVIGKALENWEGGEGVIEVVVK